MPLCSKLRKLFIKTQLGQRILLSFAKHVVYARKILCTKPVPDLPIILVLLKIMEAQSCITVSISSPNSVGDLGGFPVLFVLL
jgi:hypothetical protein